VKFSKNEAGLGGVILYMCTDSQMYVTAPCSAHVLDQAHPTMSCILLRYVQVKL